jgi:predicted amidophosphoribosyltransferase
VLVERLATRVLASILPLTCPGCGRRAEPVCVDCRAALRAPAPATPPPGIDLWLAPFAYEGVARELVARMKYRRTHAVAPWLAEAMTSLVAPPVPPVVTWAPTTAGRRRERGFDHAEVLARAVGRALRRPVRALLRRVEGPPQPGLPAAARRRGPRFTAIGDVASRILVVDDVTTTGGTLASAAATLRRGGAVHVMALTAARTPLPAG